MEAMPFDFRRIFGASALATCFLSMLAEPAAADTSYHCHMTKTDTPTNGGWDYGTEDRSFDLTVDGGWTVDPMGGGWLVQQRADGKYMVSSNVFNSNLTLQIDHGPGNMFEIGACFPIAK